MRLYYREVYWKVQFDNAIQELITKDDFVIKNHVKLNNSKHCGHNRVDIKALVSIVYKVKNNVRPYHLFEIETQMINDIETITKAVFRTNYNKHEDIVIVIVIRKDMIITAWLQKKADTHCTLDKTKYFQNNS